MKWCLLLILWICFASCIPSQKSVQKNSEIIELVALVIDKKHEDAQTKELLKVASENANEDKGLIKKDTITALGKGLGSALGLPPFFIEAGLGLASVALGGKNILDKKRSRRREDVLGRMSPEEAEKAKEL